MKEPWIIDNCLDFQWDKGNLEKNWYGHSVVSSECEEIFFNKPLLLTEDTKQSQVEDRFFALGQTNEGRRLFIAFTLRKNLIRVISARDMSKKEKGIYDK